MIVRMEHNIGTFVIEGMPLASRCTSIKQNLNPTIIREINKCFELGSFRTVSQDIAFGIQQLVDIALKSLTSSIHDITTAITCIDYLTECDLSKREIASPFIIKMMCCG